MRSVLIALLIGVSSLYAFDVERSPNSTSGNLTLPNDGMINFGSGVGGAPAYGGAGYRIVVFDNGSVKYGYGYAGSELWQNSHGVHTWYNANTEKMRFHASGDLGVHGGKLGVGIYQPVYNLHVVGETFISSQTVVAGTMTVQGNAFSVGTSTFSINAGTVVVSGLDFEVTAGTVNIIGTTYAGDAPTGYIGQYISTTPTADQNVPATNTWVSLATTTLTAGDWDVSALGYLTSGGTTVGTQLYFCISTTANDCVGGNGKSSAIFTIVANADYQIPTIPLRINVSANTAVFLTGRLTYSTAGGAAYQDTSLLQARRVR